MAALETEVLNPQQFTDLIEYCFTGDSETVLKKSLFIEQLRIKASVFHAAKAANIGRATVYRWQASDPEFARAWEDSEQDAIDVMEASVYEEALGTADKPGNALLKMFWLKAHKHKYRDKVTIDVESVRQEIQERMAQLGLEQAPIAGYLNGSHPGPHFNSGSQFSQPVQQLESQTDESQKEE